jgi:predicted metalloprotease with PDZ domain
MAQLDVDRVKFVLSDYLTDRLSKIEAHPLYLREQVDRMSEGEVAYLKQYGALLEHHLRHTVLDHIPEAWQALDEPNMIDRPDYEAYHFWLVKETIDNGGIEHDAGTCLIAKYKDMREHMRESKVELQL